MSLLTEKTPLEKVLDRKDAGILRSAEALHHAASVIAEENRRFWSEPTEDLLACLNADVALTLATFAANTAAGAAINALLDGVGDARFTGRVPTEPGRGDIVFDGSAFSITPVPSPEN
jgi:hypothetical protein